MSIPVFMSSDDKYSPFVATTIASILDNTKEKCAFYVIDMGIHDVNKDKITQVVNGFGNGTIEFISIDSSVFNELPEVRYISKAMYGRFLIPDLKPTDKAIYTDIDVVFCSDIKELYEEDLKEKVIGAVYEDFSEKTCASERKLRLNLSDTHHYFCSGLLLINCNRWREQNVLAKLMEVAQTLEGKLDCPDQDILNVFFDSNYKQLHEKYSVVNQRVKTSKECVIRHFNGRRKPWLSPPLLKLKMSLKKHEMGADLFWHYAKMTPFYDQLISQFPVSKQLLKWLPCLYKKF